MNIRSRGKRAMQERSRHYVYVDTQRLRKGRRYEFRGVHPEFGVILSGWFIANSNNPVCHVL